ncbi:MAG: hypothetical protein HY706_00395 [Candidatus Hydrogenedentes bacterium]|nr:hypothetical protein [Candidatus Hydrogenedentota bacterium]
MRSKPFCSAAVAVLCCIGLFGPVTAIAQDDSLWGNDEGVVTDTDQDGSVNATDVQQVINGALGIQRTATDAVKHPFRRYVMAAPRASLAPAKPDAEEPPPVTVGSALIEETLTQCATIGAAYNFARKHGRMAVRTGARVVFLLGRESEGVWYDGACGRLSTHLAVFMRERDAAEDSWVFLGQDGAEDVRCGPSIGRAKVGIGHLFEQPGDYLVRGIIRTRAVPVERVVSGDTEEIVPLLECGDFARDEVFVLVHVFEGEPSPEDIASEEIPEPVGDDFGEPVPSIDPNAPLPED